MRDVNMFGLGWFRKPKVVPAVQTITSVFSHEMIVIQPTQTIELVHPLLDVMITIDNRDFGQSYKFPLIVGNHGQILPTTGGRRLLYPNNSDKTSLYLDYRLNESHQKVRLKITGNRNQTISVLLDERDDPSLPLILFLKKYSSNGDVP